MNKPDGVYDALTLLENHRHTSYALTTLMQSHLHWQAGRAYMPSEKEADAIDVLLRDHQERFEEICEQLWDRCKVQPKV